MIISNGLKPNANLRIFLVSCIALIIVLANSANAEPARFEAEDDVLYMTGEIDESTPETLSKALRDNPAVVGIVMENVPGSNDDDSNLKAAMMVRNRGLKTYLPSDGIIASGGTDFFLAGVERIIEDGGCVGVHSWSDDDLNVPPTSLPKDHEGHQIFLDYYRKLGIDASFYWYTIQAASADAMHWMSKQELINYRVATGFREPDAGSVVSCDDR